MGLVAVRRRHAKRCLSVGGRIRRIDVHSGATSDDTRPASYVGSRSRPEIAKACFGFSFGELARTAVFEFFHWTDGTTAEPPDRCRMPCVVRTILFASRTMRRTSTHGVATFRSFRGAEIESCGARSRPPHERHRRIKPEPDKVYNSTQQRRSFLQVQPYETGPDSQHEIGFAGCRLR